LLLLLYSLNYLKTSCIGNPGEFHPRPCVHEPEPEPVVLNHA
jgi:hypothetical protein